MEMKRTVMVGKYKLVEQPYLDDSICTVFLGNRKIAVYCSMADAVQHRPEWFEE